MKNYTCLKSNGEYTYVANLSKNEMVVKSYKGKPVKSNLIKTRILFINDVFNKNQIEEKHRDNFILEIAKNNIKDLYDILKILPDQYCTPKVVEGITELNTRPLHKEEISNTDKKFNKLREKRTKDYENYWNKNFQK